VSVSGGTFGVSRNIRGGSYYHGAPSQYYMFSLPCQQAEGDDDENQVTDVSGKEAHASINSLTTAEIWANAGYATTIASSDHYPEVPVANWPFRFTTDSLILSLYLQAASNGSSSLRFFGNGYDSTHTGIIGYIGSTGAVAFSVNNATTIIGGNGTSETPYGSDSLHCVGFAYDAIAQSSSYYIDGAFSLTSTALTATNLTIADSAVTADIAIGGWAGNGNLLASKVKYVHALRFPGMGLPSNTAALMHRLWSHPHLLLSDRDIG
jgi:hypothetical protein